jgi:hypothetical protein
VNTSKFDFLDSKAIARVALRRREEMKERIKAWLQRRRCRRDQHNWKLPYNSSRLNVTPGCHVYERECVVCGTYQRVSTTLGLHFLEEQRTPAPNRGDERPEE